MRSALRSVKGVKRVKVTLEENEALVTYDPAQTKVEDLVEAVRNAKGMHEYSAEVKKPKQ